MKDDPIVLLDDKTLLPVGSAPKLASHHGSTPLHLAFSCWLFNEKGEVLITQRAFEKKVWPGVWTNSFCGHPLPGESFPEAIKRRAEYELGITKPLDLQEALPDYRYTTPPYQGIIENEFCPVFFSTIDIFDSRKINPLEVRDYKFVELDFLIDDINKNPTEYSYWIVDQLEILRSRSLL